MSVKRLILLVGFIAASALGPVLTGDAVVEAAPPGVKFFVVDWRISWEDGEDGLLLQLKGRTRGTGCDLGNDFELQTRNVEPLLEVLRTCAMGRLTGTSSIKDTRDGTVTGDKLTSLSCRAILK